MKILLCSHFFSPSIGGIETLSLALAKHFTSAGHEVIVLTRSSSSVEDHFPFKVVRHPNLVAQWKYVRWSDVVFHNNICASLAWPLALIKRPWVIAHHTWITRPDGKIGFRERLKRTLVSRATQIADSVALAEDFGGKATVVGGCYDEKQFRILDHVQRNQDLIFVGRLVSDKGADLLIDSIFELKQMGKELSLTIVGSGVELENLRSQADRLGVSNQILFKGTLIGDDLVGEINKHRIMVVPSRWNEPFGIVALLGIACGCVVIGSSGGGLSDAIGPCGLVVQNDNLDALVKAIDRLISSPDECSSLLDQAPPHLMNFTEESVAYKYLKIIEESTR